MPEKIDRKDLILRLEGVQPGIGTPVIEKSVEQTICFAFKGGEVFTYRDEIACRGPGLPDAAITGAVQSKPLLAYLAKMGDADATVEIVVEGNELVVSGKGRRKGIRIRMEAEVLLPTSIEQPESWRPLPDGFNEAVSIVGECAGTDETVFDLTCVHVHPRWVEACDGLKMARYKIDTGVGEPLIVRRDSLAHVPKLGMAEWGETKGWLHFRRADGLTLSCRRYLEEYRDLSAFLKVEGAEKIDIPKTLGEAMARAEVSSSDVGSSEDNQVLVELRDGEMTIKAQGATSRTWERKKVAYRGDPIAFLASPKLLTELAEKHQQAEVTPDRLMVKGERWRFVACLERVEQGGPKEGGPVGAIAVGEEEGE